MHGGIVDPPAFYALLRVWRTFDALNFSSLACVIHPEPGPILVTPHEGRAGRPNDLHALPPADPIEFVQTNFYAVDVQGMQIQLNLVQVSSIVCFDSCPVRPFFVQNSHAAYKPG